MTIEFSQFSFQYESLDKPTLVDINLRIEQGEKVVIVGPSGSGKSTMGHCLNGLVPHALKGKVTGSLKINGKETSAFSMNDYSEKVGTVLQDTDNQFVGLSVAEDIAFALENQLVKNIDMYPLVKATAEMVELGNMLNHSPYELSGGQKQRVSLAGILVDDVEILLFDEPLAALDPKTSQKTIEIIDKLHAENNKTIVIIEHRLEDVLFRHVDRVIMIDEGRVVADLTPDQILSSSLLSRHGIREPLYLSALKAAGCCIAETDFPSKLSLMPVSQYQATVSEWFEQKSQPDVETKSESLLEIEDISYSYDGEVNALENVSFTVNKGEMVSVLGKNGSGKSTLTKLIMGVLPPDSGTIKVNSLDLSDMTIFERSQRVGVVMQNPNHMISHHMIFDEVAFGLRNRGLKESEVEEKVQSVLALCGLKKYRNWPVEALSYGQKKRVTIASILVLEPEILILDEPTAGQDYRNYTAMMRFVEKLNREQGVTVIVISHDMHLVLEYTHRSIVFADGILVEDSSMTKVFSNPVLLEKANLTTTSLYQLATQMEIKDTDGFMEHFIAQEKVA